MEAQRGAEGTKASAVSPATPELHLHLLDADLAEDVISTYRWRESVWLSLATHGVIILLLILIPKWTANRAVIVPIKEKPENMMVVLPDDLSKPKTPPKTNIVSDKDRLASSNKPTLDKDALRKIIDARKPGTPKPAPAPPTQQAAQQNPAPAQAPQPPAQQAPQQSAQIEGPKPAPAGKSPFAIASPGASVNQAIQSVANGHASGIDYGPSGDYGSAVRPKTDRKEGMEILSDTLGVDFGPYMKRLHYTVQNHWDPLIPESALPPVMKKGIVVIQFSISKDGRVSGMKLIASSGDVALDRAAWGAITDAIPLPRLPVQFSGDYLELRARFYYNPDKNDLE